MRTFAIASSVVCFSLIGSLAFAAEHEPKEEHKVLPPATRYSGGTAIELHNGILFNNGTYGTPNADYEAWAKSPMVVAGLSERPYSYAQRQQFLTVLDEQVQWGDAAIANWKSTSNEFPDAVTYAKAAIDKMSPPLDKLKSAVKSANGANEGSWTSAESDARRALIDFRVAYMQMHKNVQARQSK